jgi:hypothetical protein
MIPAMLATMAASSANRVEELGKQFLRALDPYRVQSLALVDGGADVVWLSCGAMGPDEHALVSKSLDAFTVERERAVIDRRLEDNRRALFFAARDPFGACCGLVLALIEARGGSEAPPAPGAHLQALLRRFSALLAPPLPQKGSAEAPPAAAAAVAGGSPIHARKYSRLQGGGSTRRYEVAAGSGEDGDLTAIERIAVWLTRNRGENERDPAILTAMVGAGVIEDTAFIGRVKAIVQRHQIERGRLGLGLPSAAWREQSRLLARFLGECEVIGCSVTLDDFSLRRDAIALLQYPAVRCLKIDVHLTAHAMTDRVAQAELAAIVQAARVLGLHCVAKSVASTMAAKGLAALGIDFADRISDERKAGSTTKTGEALALEQAG